MDPCGWVRLFVLFFFHWFRGISDVSKKKRKKEDFLLAFSSEMAAILLLLIACPNFRIPPAGELVSTWFYWVLPSFFCLVSDRWPWFPDDWFVGRRCGRWCWFDGSTCASATVGVGPDRWLNSYPTADGFFFFGRSGWFSSMQDPILDVELPSRWSSHHSNDRVLLQRCDWVVSRTKLAFFCVGSLGKSSM